MKAIVVYYSYEGSTKAIAEAIAKALDADILALHPVNEKKTQGFSKYIWGGSQVMMKKTPLLKDFETNFDAYDLVLVGSPTWAGTYTPPIKSLFENHHLKGKKVAYFYTHLGGNSKVEKRMDALVSQENTLIAVKDFKEANQALEDHQKNAMAWAKTLI